MSAKVLTVTLNPSIDKTITVEKFIPYGLNRVIKTRQDPGGKGINVAKVLKNFGVDVTVFGLIAGSQGKLLTDFLSKAGIETDFLQIPGETRTNLKIFDKNVNKMTEINETGCQVTAEIMDSLTKKFKESIQGAAVVVFSGSLPPGIPDDFYAECIAMAKSNGIKTVLDADASALAEGIKAVPYAVKPNIHELELLNGCHFVNSDEVVDAVKELINTGIEIVIVSMGADGAIVANKDEVYKVDSWDIRVRSATGAGDSMVGSLVYSLLENDSLYEIAKITTAAGTITASKEGTQLCTKNEVLQSLEKVTVKNILV